MYVRHLLAPTARHQTPTLGGIAYPTLTHLRVSTFTIDGILCAFQLVVLFVDVYIKIFPIKKGITEAMVESITS